MLHQCLLCEYSTHHTTTIKRHVQKHINDRPFKCSICQKRFIQNTSLKKHLLVHHSIVS